MVSPTPAFLARSRPFVTFVNDILRPFGRFARPNRPPRGGRAAECAGLRDHLLPCLRSPISKYFQDFALLSVALSRGKLLKVNAGEVAEPLNAAVFLNLPALFALADFHLFYSAFSRTAMASFAG